MNMKDRIAILKLEAAHIDQKVNLLRGILAMYHDVEVLVDYPHSNNEIYVSAEAHTEADGVEFYWERLRLYAWPFIQLNGARVHAKRGGIELGNRDYGKNLVLDEILECFPKKIKTMIYQKMEEENIIYSR